jgi:hypothetical protein
MATTFWIEFGILYAGALTGGIVIMPYVLKLLNTAAQSKPLKMPIRTMVLLSFLQTAVIFAVVTAVGLAAAHAIGLGAPYLEAAITGSVALGMAPAFALAAVLGIIAGAVLLVADLWLLPYWPAKLVEASLRTTLWDNFLASIYGGINEELLMRLCGVSVLAWLLSLVFHPASDAPTTAVLWTVNIIMTIVFGLGHLPALKSAAGELSRTMFARSLILNAPVGLLCGWLFWTYGIEAAIIAHFSADIIYHVLGTAVLRRRLSSHHLL